MSEIENPADMILPSSEYVHSRSQFLSDLLIQTDEDHLQTI
jgi:hypothetical protein